MTTAPEWQVYDYEGRYQAACKDLASAACLVSFYGDRSTIRYGHINSEYHDMTVWTEGNDYDGTASDSYALTHLRILGRIGAV